VAVVVEVADDRHVDPELVAELPHHLRNGRRGLLGVDGHPDELGAGVREPCDLDRGGVGVGGVGVRHRLDDDRMGAPDEHAADVDRYGRSTPWAAIDGDRRAAGRRLIHGRAPLRCRRTGSGRGRSR
jgi:hypothetical protein